MTVLTVGVGKQFSTITGAVGAAHSGDRIDVSGGTYVNDFPALISGLTIHGVGGTVHLVSTATLPNGAAMFDVTGNTTLENLDFAGSSAIAVKYEGGNLKIQNSTFEANQSALLTAGDPSGTIWVDHSEFAQNGTGGSTTIDVGDIARLTITNSYIHDGGGAAEVRSRAEMTVVTDSRIYDNKGGANYAIDLPNGGDAIIERNTLEKGVSGGASAFISYGETPPLHAGMSVTVVGNQFVNDSTRLVGYIYYDRPGTAFHSDANYMYGVSPYNIEVSRGMPATGFEAMYSIPNLPKDSPLTPVMSNTTAPAVSATQSASGLISGKTVYLSGLVLDGSIGTEAAGVYVFDYYQSQLHSLGLAAVGSDGQWSFAATGLSDGGHDFELLVEDSGYGINFSTGPTVNVDTTGPVLSVTAANQGQVTSGSGIALSGVATDAGSGVTSVDLLDDTNGVENDLGRVTVVGGVWQMTISHLSAGLHSFSTVATDKVGNTAVSAPISLQTVTATTLTPTIQRIVGNMDGGVTLLGTSQPNSVVDVTGASVGVFRDFGTTTAAADGTFRLTSHTKLVQAAPTTFSVSASDSNGAQGTNSGLFQLSGAGSDTLYGTTHQSDVFAMFLRTGQDTIVGFETTKAAGAQHDVIDLSGTGYAYYGQVAPHITGTSSAVIQLDATRSITLLGVSGGSLQASDFRFS